MARPPLRTTTIPGWLLANAGGWLFASLFFSFVEHFDPAGLSSLPEQALTAIVVSIAILAFALAGLIVSIPQALSLAPIDVNRPRWILATTIGFPLGFGILGTILIGLFLPHPPERMTFEYWILEATLPAVGFGVGVGLMQWPLMRHRIRRPFLWPLAHAIGYPLGLLAWKLLPDRILSLAGLSPAEAYDFLYRAFYSIGLQNELRFISMGMGAALLASIALACPNANTNNGAA